MTSIRHDVPQARQEPRRWLLPSVVTELGASVAIAVIWLAVLFDAVFGPNIETSNGAGTNTSSVPSAVAVAVFAFLATWVIAKYGYGRADRE
jgi:hypothetical protein